MNAWRPAAPLLQDDFGATVLDRIERGASADPLPSAAEKLLDPRRGDRALQNMTPASLRRCFRTVAALVLPVVPTLSLNGCGTSAPLSEKARSFDAYRDRRIGETPLTDFLAARAPRIVIGPRPTEAEGVVHAQGATAVAIAGDGYFLTAAHVLEGVDASDVYLVHPDTTKACRIRVVWNGFRETDGAIDLAIIHSTTHPTAWFRWAPTRELVARTPVVSVGFPSLQRSFAAGELLEDLRPDGRIAAKVAHSVPLAGGDSGGPLCTLEGELVAVNYGAEALTPIGGILRCVAIRPDPDWLSGILAGDRSRR